MYEQIRYHLCLDLHSILSVSKSEVPIKRILSTFAVCAACVNFQMKSSVSFVSFVSFVSSVSSSSSKSHKFSNVS